MQYIGATGTSCASAGVVGKILMALHLPTFLQGTNSSIAAQSTRCIKSRAKYNDACVEDAEQTHINIINRLDVDQMRHRYNVGTTIAPYPYPHQQHQYLLYMQTEDLLMNFCPWYQPTNVVVRDGLHLKCLHPDFLVCCVLQPYSS